MKVLLFDPGAGASGDMIMACLLDLGANLDVVRQAVESVGCTLEVSRQEKSHIMACRARVISDRRFQSLSEAVSILQDSSLQGKAREDALAALDTLAGAESRVHGVAKEKARFHEIGALDALADIAGSCAARHCLGLERVFCRPISVGGGNVASAHGLLAVPGPAALEILRTRKMPWKGGPVEEELLTPTGTALLATLVDEFVPDFPLMQAEKVGYGAGKKELVLPNVLRAIVADSMLTPQAKAGQNHGAHGDRVVQLETNVDDVTGEVLGYMIEKLMQAGALDVSVLPALMKKGRSGNVIRAIARAEEAKLLAMIMIQETGSLGVRVFPSVHRFLAERELMAVQVEIGGQVFPAQVKVSRMDGKLISAKPEYEDCKKIAEETDLPLRMIIKKVEEAGWQAREP
ncbi:MAG: nickel pincer cofactor biosynthesis protein LarC [Methanotrichaceae archaeon]|nr:nickel pincer cofactor biosynthesis protein LarC [Methanotrichaceae archaeon]